MSHLYEISKDYQDVLNMEIETEEDAKALVALLNESKARFEEKAENLLKVVKNLEGEAAMFNAEAAVFKAEADRLYKAQRARDSKVAALKEYLKFNMNSLNLSKLKAGTFSVSLVNGRKTLEISPLAKIPSQFVIKEVVENVDKDALLEFVQSLAEDGNVVEGVSVKQAQSLRVA